MELTNLQERRSLSVDQPCQSALYRLDELGRITPWLKLAVEHRSKGFSFVFPAHQEEHISCMVQQRGREGDTPGLELWDPYSGRDERLFFQDVGVGKEGGRVTVRTQTQQYEIELRPDTRVQTKMPTQILLVALCGPPGIGVLAFDAMQLRV